MRLSRVLLGFLHSGENYELIIKHRVPRTLEVKPGLLWSPHMASGKRWLWPSLSPPLPHQRLGLAGGGLRGSTLNLEERERRLSRLARRKNQLWTWAATGDQLGLSLSLPTASRRARVLFLWLEKLRCLCQLLHSPMQHLEVPPSCWLDFLENPAPQSAGSHLSVLCRQTAEPQHGKYSCINKGQYQIQICG